jgi:hypothetical protein
MKTYAEPQQEVVAEQKLASITIQRKGINQRILYVLLGVGVILLVIGLISFLIK